MTWQALSVRPYGVVKGAEPGVERKVDAIEVRPHRCRSLVYVSLVSIPSHFDLMIDTAHHVIDTHLNHRFVSYMTSYDVSSHICQAQWEQYVPGHVIHTRFEPSLLDLSGIL